LFYQKAFFPLVIILWVNQDEPLWIGYEGVLDQHPPAFDHIEWMEHNPLYTHYNIISNIAMFVGKLIILIVKLPFS